MANVIDMPLEVKSRTNKIQHGKPQPLVDNMRTCAIVGVILYKN